MAEGSLISDRARAMVGQVLARGRREIEKGALRNYVWALGETNPLYSDEEHAKTTKYGGIICPPTFLGGPGGDYPEGPRQEIPDLPPNRLNGGQEVELLKPIRPSEVLTYETRLVDLVQRDGSTGSMVISTSETTFTNQQGEVVAKTRSIGIARP
ncbi:MAG: MaoC family dehydratase N-terminal domain-containing protein [Chloroflexi bacterium]|nr:MaoC family dehydratase N-terminal domain-containing protein [Chloroflexota bacterium]